MDATLVKAGIVAAVGLTLLVPTFNALNLSYVENVQPPPWMPPPTKPPNITPPTDFEPPPDMTPPTDWEGEIPPGACPPPVIRVLNESIVRNQQISGTPTQTWQITRSWTLPEGAIALGGWVNFTNWQGQRAIVQLTGPKGFDAWAPPAATGNILQPQGPSAFRYNSTEGDNPRPPPAGDYELTLRVDTPVQGNAEAKFVMALACGGMMSR